ncbi:MAG: hypothetical protein HFE63_01465 [Clostridiales bacterium]|nr:hypothetical protein [Clostridiales bacterium]
MNTITLAIVTNALIYSLGIVGWCMIARAETNKDKAIVGSIFAVMILLIAVVMTITIFGNDRI